MKQNDQPSVPPILLRGFARVLDLGVHFVIMEVAFWCSTFLPPYGLVSLGDDLLFAVDVAVGIGALLTYTTISEWLGRATFGKACTGLRVVGADEYGVGPSRAVVRSLAFLVDSFLFGFIAYSTMVKSERRQRLGDHWAKTVVVWRRDAPEGSAWRGWPVGVIFALVMVVGSYLVVR